MSCARTAACWPSAGSLGFEETADPDDPAVKLVRLRLWAPLIRRHGQYRVSSRGGSGERGGHVPVALADKVAFLGAAESHAGERPGSVEAIETHMSWVFLTDRFAYKLKKPVRHPLIDLRSLEARRRNCLVEVRLNRRLAPDVYLGTLPLTFAPHGDGLRLGGDGRVVDWLVVMRRLPAELMLDRALRSGGPERADLDRVALEARPVLPGARARADRRPMRGAAGIEDEIELSWRELGRTEFGLDSARIERIAGRLERLPARAAGTADRAPPRGADRRGARRSAARAHLPRARAGDHRLPRVQPPRCASSIPRTSWPSSLWSAPCWASRAPARGSSAATRRMTGDRPPAPLIAWYTGCRALLRARLSALHSREPGPRPPAAWLAQAERYLDAALAYTDGAVLRQAEPRQPLERLLAVQPADRLGEQRRGVEHGEVRRHRLRLQPEGRHRVGDDQPLEARAGQRPARPRR